MDQYASMGLAITQSPASSYRNREKLGFLHKSVSNVW